MSLYPTPTRLALLRDVEAGRVVGHLPYAVLLSPDARPRHVPDRMRELKRARWVEQIDTEVGEGWRLTAVGQAVLDADNVHREQKAAEIAAEHFHLTSGDLKGTR